jgi:hypothetical protein
MRPITLALCLALLVLPADAQGVAPAADPVAAAAMAPIPAGQHRLDEFKWQNRLVVVFADTPRDPAFVRQMELLKDRPQALAEREVVVLTDTDPSAQSPIRTALRPRGFALVLLDKDGSVIQRKPSPWDLREIGRAIDKTPQRQQELREKRQADRPLIGLPVTE